MAALAIIGHSPTLLATLYAAIEEEFPVMDSIDLPDETVHEYRGQILEDLIDMLIGVCAVPEDLVPTIESMQALLDNDMLVDMINMGEVTGLILNDNGFYLAELRGEHAA